MSLAQNGQAQVCNIGTGEVEAGGDQIRSSSATC